MRMSVLETSRELGVEGLDGIDMACRARFFFFLVERFERSDVMRKCRSHAGELVCEVVGVEETAGGSKASQTTTIDASVLLKATPLDDSLVYILPPYLVCKRNRRIFCSLKRVSNQILAICTYGSGRE
jgi:hypothetical protein